MGLSQRFGAAPVPLRRYLTDWKGFLLKTNQPINLVGDLYKLLGVLGAEKIDLSSLENSARFGGAFWMREYHDRFIRNEIHFLSSKTYIEENPVKAGLAASPAEWRWSSAWKGRLEAGAPSDRAQEPGAAGSVLKER